MGALSALGYVLVIILSYAFRDANVDESSIRPYLRVHNAALSVYSLLTALIVGCELWDRSFSWHSMACETDWNSDWAMRLFVASKCWEWLDTMFLILRNRKLRAVHCIHHATTFWIYWAMLGTPSSTYATFANACVHALMYWHYYRPFPRFVRPWLTRMQLLQFVVGIAMQHYGALTCRDDFWTFNYQLVHGMVCIFTALFVNFYVQQYVKTTLVKQK